VHFFVVICLVVLTLLYNKAIGILGLQENDDASVGTEGLSSSERIINLISQTAVGERQTEGTIPQRVEIMMCLFSCCKTIL
jgi:hypothetical protein